MGLTDPKMYVHMPGGVLEAEIERTASSADRRRATSVNLYLCSNEMVSSWQPVSPGSACRYAFAGQCHLVGEIWPPMKRCSGATLINEGAMPRSGAWMAGTDFSNTPGIDAA